MLVTEKRSMSFVYLDYFNYDISGSQMNRPIFVQFLWDFL